jgi:cation diffusion facilitator CzcD-associated flavoprotein CzcO
MEVDTTVIIIGAGLGGLCSAITLQKAGVMDFRIIEKSNKVGGTWLQNSYPGASCDTPNWLYQYSFAPSVHWRNVFPYSDEIQEYAEFLVEQFHLSDKLHSNTEMVSVIWDEDRKLWEVRTKDRSVYRANYVITALGQLNVPRIPDIQGADDFQVDSFHSSQWDHSVDLSNKRVGIIGTAASASQIIPEVAKVAEKLTVFQRSPNWVIPRHDRKISKEEQLLIAGTPEVVDRNRDAVYVWIEHQFWQVFSWTDVGRNAFERMALDYLKSSIECDQLQEKLTPDYPIGCKRVIFSDHLYKAYRKDNVALECAPISRICSSGVVDSEGKTHELDVLVYATGFDATSWIWSSNIIGSEGVPLSEIWSDFKESYLGVTTHGFPNFFMVFGPNTNLGHGPITYMHEKQCNYIAEIITYMERSQSAKVDVKKDVQEQFVNELKEKLSTTVWADPACNSWYKTAEGEITQNWSSHTRDYAEILQAFNIQDFDFD